MHNRSHLLSLEQRRAIQLLCFMYMHKQHPNNLKVPVKNTCAPDRDEFNVERFKNSKYKNSPFLKGAEIWKSLLIDLANSNCLFQFKRGLRNMYKKLSDV